MSKTNIIGSISHGTMRTKDLVPCFMNTLEELNPARAQQIRQEWSDTLDNLDTEAYQDDADYLLNEVLFDALNAEAPAYFYFGAHPGDGSDHGFWLCEDWQQSLLDDGGIVVSDLSEVPEDFDGTEVAVVNDHGNATLYAKDGDKLSEVWAIG